MGHMSALEPTSEAWRSLEPMDACQRRSPPRWRGGVWCPGMHGSVRALLDGEVRSGAPGHVAASEPSQALGQGPEPWDTW
jgi:hypothetical protein